MQKSLFESYPKLTISCLILIGVTIILISLEFAARLFGLGNPILYNAHPIYGYRPAPNQDLVRQGHHIKTNNLGLRAEADWDPSLQHHKILFLGDSVTYGGSYISNNQLFSSLVAKSFTGYQGGNAGVNAWGVENVCALVKETGFAPAEIYISTFPEGDFYRGLMRIGGQPFWTVKPRFALEELFQFWIYRVNEQKTPPIYFYSLNETEKCLIAEHAVSRLKQLDDFLVNKNYLHLIFISPSRSQVLGNATYDPCLQQLFTSYGLKVIYINDKLPKSNDNERHQWFYDEIHLSTLGHQQWAKVISNELNVKMKPQLVNAHGNSVSPTST